jgi:PKD repeat protein
MKTTCRTVAALGAVAGLFCATTSVADPPGQGGGETGAEGNPPIAVANVVDQDGLTVDLSARGSFDPDDEALTFAWDFGDGVGTDTGGEVQYAYSMAGTYIAVVTATDPTGLIGAAAIKLIVAEANEAPIADATSPASVTCGDVVQLDGSGSTDPDGDDITYAWSAYFLPAGSTAELNDDSVFAPSFTTDVEGDYTYSLIVSDGLAESSPALTTTRCTGGQSCPIGQEDCGGFCSDLSTDENNCGACGQACGSGELCISGACTVSCPSGQTDCGGSCVNTDTDANNCGGCGQTCAVGEFCVAGECAASP